MIGRLHRNRNATKTKHQKKKYEEEKIHFVRATGLVIIAVAFLASAVLSVYTFAKTREIVAHADIYRKQRDYDCSVETDDRELSTTGTSQLLTVNSKVDTQSNVQWSPELNKNPHFIDSNPNEPELPIGYRNSSSSDVSASFLHDKLNHTLHTFANIAGDKGGQAGWYMEYISVQANHAYKFTTNYILDKAKAVIVAEEVDSQGVRKYTDLAFLSPDNGHVTQSLVFIPQVGTTQLRFFSQLTSMGSMNLFEESVVSTSQYQLAVPLITVSFDDGWVDVYKTAKPILDELGIKTSQNIIAESFRSLLAGYMNLGEVKQLAKEGHEIASHSLRHCNLVRLSESNLDYDIKASKLVLESEFANVRGLAYPYGSYDDVVEAEAAKSYDYIRTTENGFDSLLSNTHRLRGLTITPAISLDDFKKYVDFAVHNKLWINIIYHRVGDDSGEYGVHTEALRHQLEYLKLQPAAFVTAAEAVDSIERQQLNIIDPVNVAP